MVYSLNTQSLGCGGSLNKRPHFIRCTAAVAVFAGDGPPQQTMLDHINAAVGMANNGNGGNE